jgi:hypothetical protein
VAGVAAIGLFYLLLRRTTSGVGLLTGLALFAVSPKLVYYSSEVKQYILDVAVTISLLLLVLPILERRAGNRNYVVLGVAGLLGMWFSHPASFVLAGIGTVLLVQALTQRDQFQFRSILLMGIVWLANLGLLYFISLQGLSQNTFLLDYWQENFIPLPPWSDWEWFGIVFSGLNQNLVGIQISAWLIAIMHCLGFIALYTKNKSYAVIVLIIFGFSLIASALRLYPLGGRLSLFLVPLVIILISQSIDTLEQRLNAQHNWGKLVAILVGIYLLYAPIDESISAFRNPKYFEHIRPSMATLSENWQPGDKLFVSNGAVPAFRFYADRYGLGDVDFKTSEATDYSDPDKIVSRLQALDGYSRVWVLVTHVYETKDFNEKNFLLSSFDQLGEHKREFRSPGTSVYLNLYDLGQ